MKKRLHEDIALQLRREILVQGEPGQRLPSEEALAKRFDVSLVTLRNATQSLEEEGFVRRLSGIGVVVAERRKQGTIALVSREITLLPRPLYFHLRFDPLLRKELFQADWRTTSYLQLETDSGEDGLGDLREALSQARHSALLWTPGRIPPDLLALAAHNGTPVFDGNQVLDATDYGLLIRIGVDHLHAQGCRHIAGLFSAPSLKWEIPQAATFAEQFARRLHDHGLPVEPRWIVQNSEAWQAGSGWQGFRDLWSASDTRPDGLLVLDDFLYRDAARAILELGIRIPDQLRIVTHANRDDDIVHPFPVSLLEIDPVALAVETARRVVAALERRPIEEKRIPPHLHPARVPSPTAQTKT